MKHDIHILAFLLALLGVYEKGYASISSNVLRDTTRQVIVYFEVNNSRINYNYHNNNEAIVLLDSLLGQCSKTESVTSLKGEVFASPEGNYVNNIDLCKQRRETVYNLLQCYNLHVNKEQIELSVAGEDWTGLRKLVADNASFPNQQEVLMIIDYHRNDIIMRKQALQKLNGGIPYQTIVRDILPELRRVVITIVQELPEKDNNIFTPGTSTPELFVSKKGEEFPDDCPNKTRREISEKQACEVTMMEVEDPVENKTILAVKNNLLYDLALAPNLEIEIPIGKRWSLNTEYKCPWWLNNKHKFCYQLLSGGLEGRYWLGNRQKRNRLTGHFLGLYAEGGIYDFQFGGDGYQGKYYGATGITYGYARQLARHFSLEFSLGLGYLSTEYKKYTPYEGDIVWMNSGRYHFIGPTKAKVSLVWLITGRR